MEEFCVSISQFTPSLSRLLPSNGFNIFTYCPMLGSLGYASQWSLAELENDVLLLLLLLFFSSCWRWFWICSSLSSWLLNAVLFHFRIVDANPSACSEHASAQNCRSFSKKKEQVLNLTVEKLKWSPSPVLLLHSQQQLTVVWQASEITNER